MHKSSQWWDRPATETFSYPPEVPGLTERTRAVLQQRWGGSISEPGGSITTLVRIPAQSGTLTTGNTKITYNTTPLLAGRQDAGTYKQESKALSDPHDDSYEDFYQNLCLDLYNSAFL